MNLNDIELILLKVIVNKEHAIMMKFYRNGLVVRYGTGGIPQINIAGMSHFEQNDYFEYLMDRIPQELVEKPFNYEEDTPNGTMEYMVGFYGQSLDGTIGEDTQWGQAAGLRFVLDTQTTFRHEMMAFVDAIVTEAAEVSNSWYFDIVLDAVYEIKSSSLPKGTIVSKPNSEKEVDIDFKNYVSQIRYSAKNWDITSFAENKVFVAADKRLIVVDIEQENIQVSFKFQYLEAHDDESEAEQAHIAPQDIPTKKPRWKFW